MPRLIPSQVPALVGGTIRTAALLWVLSRVPAATAEPIFSDSFDTVAGWKVIAADGVVANLAGDAGSSGPGLRLDFDFVTGGGFCIVRKELPLELPPNFRITFDIKGDCKPNNLELKLIDGENVWWVNRRAFEFSKDWATITQKTRKFTFAWGPSPATAPAKLTAIEFAVASAEGGKGSIWLDKLVIEQLPVISTDHSPPRLEFSSFDASRSQPPQRLPESGVIDWVHDSDDRSPTVTLDFDTIKEIGGVSVNWTNAVGNIHYTVAGSTDGRDWHTLFDGNPSEGGRDFHRFGENEFRFLRVGIDWSYTAGPRFLLHSIKLMPIEVADSANAFLEWVSRESPRGWYPRYFLGEMQPWTVVGAPRDTEEALIDAGGAVEIGRGQFRIEPFLWLDGRLITWADVTAELSLLDGYLPVPTVKWSVNGVDLEITASALPRRTPSSIEVTYRLVNRHSSARSGKLFLVCRPFQVLPPWHELNLTGGVGRITHVTPSPHTSVTISDRFTVYLDGREFEWGAGTFASGQVAERLSKGIWPKTLEAKDAQGWVSGAFQFEFALDPGASQEYFVEVASAQGTDAHARPNSFDASSEAVRDRARQVWNQSLNDARIELPGGSETLVNTFRTAQAHILINADGPAIQPGSRTYERSWIRDGAITSTALLYTGHFKEAVDFLDWYGNYQFPNGKIPCVVDRRGPDPVDEHDSTGQYIYLVLQCYRFTRDRTILERHLPKVESAVNYLQGLRAKRMTDEFRNGAPEKRAMFGLVPESISHEGYSTKPMHSYWDDLWVMRGLKDATEIARLLEKPELESRCASLRDEFRSALYDSMRLAMETKKIEYIPGCVELGDFDATSTATGVFPCGELDNLPQPALGNTFDRYMKFFRDRRDGQIEWEAYTPYEIRIASSLLRMGRLNDTHELLDYFLANRLPNEWNQWPEVTWKNPLAPRFVGDIPHTWVGSEFICAVRGLIVYEHEADECLELAAGVRKEWLAAPTGVNVSGFPTWYGRVSYRIRSQGEQIVLDWEIDGPLPPGGIRLAPCLGRPETETNALERPVVDFVQDRWVLRSLKGHLNLVRK